MNPLRLLLFAVHPKALIATIVLLTAPGLAAAEVITGRVVRVPDGDTVTLLVDRRQVRVRVGDIDAPEVTGQPYGQASRRSLSEMVAGVDVSVDVKDRDAYGRVVGPLYRNGVNIGREQVRRGYAWAAGRYNRDPLTYPLQLQARYARRGLWADPDPVPPWEWRATRREERGRNHGGE